MILCPCGPNLKKYAPESFVIVVSNPLDVMVYAMKEITGFPKNRVMGMAGVLDSSRFRYFVSAELGISVREISAFVLGGHGDTMSTLRKPRYSWRRASAGLVDGRSSG